MCCGLSEKRYLKVAAIPTKNQNGGIYNGAPAMRGNATTGEV